MLKQKILDEIAANGDMPIDRYMQICNEHYYSTRDPLGKDGDFTTAPEICQVFGETIALWAITKWQELGKPQEIAIVELGAGRGTLMADLLRALKVAPDFKPEIHIVEISPILREKQKNTLCHSALDAESSQSAAKIPHQVRNDGLSITWHKMPPTLEKPTIVIANEFFDALPIQQFIAGKERTISEQNGALVFSSPAELIEEKSPVSQQIMSNISSNYDAGIIIDYGYIEGSGDSFQAMKNHAYHNPLENCGEVDLTAHVNFAALKDAAKKPCDIITQAEFLLRFGGDVRAKMLGLETDFDRLINPKEMGELFKVLCF